jgi:hypothetical protein
LVVILVDAGPGLPAIIGAVAYLKGVYDVRKAKTRDV